MTRLLIPLGLVGGLASCATAEVDMPFDSDEDGLMDTEEAELGLDPYAQDSDGDSYLDPEELEAGTDPTDPESHPYLGGWPMDPCADTTTGTGSSEGDVADNFELVDQFGETVSLYDFCDHAVLLVTAAFW